MIGSDRARPASVSGSRPPSGHLERARAHLLQRIEHALHRPLAQARRRHRRSRVTGEPATAPMASRQPVPELPKSSGPAGCAKPPTPTPANAPEPVRRCARPSRRARAWPRRCCSTSSPSSSPVTAVSPTVIAPKISARCEIDLSPGTRMRPCRGPPRRAVSGVGAGAFTGNFPGICAPSYHAAGDAVIRACPVQGAFPLLTAAPQLAK